MSLRPQDVAEGEGDRHYRRAEKDEPCISARVGEDRLGRAEESEHGVGRGEAYHADDGADGCCRGDGA